MLTSLAHALDFTADFELARQEQALRCEEQLQLPGRCGDQGSDNSPRVAFDLSLPYPGQCMSSLPYNRAALTIADHAESAGMVHASATASTLLKVLHVRRHYGESPKEWSCHMYHTCESHVDPAYCPHALYHHARAFGVLEEESRLSILAMRAEPQLVDSPQPRLQRGSAVVNLHPTATQLG